MRRQASLRLKSVANRVRSSTTGLTVSLIAPPPARGARTQYEIESGVSDATAASGVQACSPITAPDAEHEHARARAHTPHVSHVPRVTYSKRGSALMRAFVSVRVRARVCRARRLALRFRLGCCARTHETKDMRASMCWSWSHLRHHPAPTTVTPPGSPRPSAPGLDSPLPHLLRDLRAQSVCVHTPPLSTADAFALLPPPLTGKE